MNQKNLNSITALFLIFLLFNLPLAAAQEVSASGSDPASSADKTPPELEVKFPEIIAGTSLVLSGSSEPEAVIKVTADSTVKALAKADKEGKFTVTIILKEQETHVVSVTAVDSAGNEASVEGKIISDLQPPVITLNQLPKIVTERSLTITGTISEESSYEIFLNEHSVVKSKGQKIDKVISLEDGVNNLKVTATDQVGFNATQEVVLTADLQKQFVRAEIENGNEYYENSASSDISGQTKPNSKVYLYVFRPLGYQYVPDFSKARAVVVADSKGEFKFKEVNFARDITDIANLRLEDLAPKQVPPDLLKVVLFSSSGENQQQQLTYQIFIISEDAQQQIVYLQQTVRVNSCSSGDFSFAIQSMPQFQLPLRLVPQLLDGGRQEIQAVFDLQYQGTGIPWKSKSAPAYSPSYSSGNYGVGGVGPAYGSYGYSSAQETIDTEQGFRVSSLQIEKACTQNQVKDEKNGLGCRIIPNANHVVKNNDGTKFYVTWKLGRTKEFSKSKEDFWNEFKNRRLTFPLKITVNYQERQNDGTWGASKVQASCYDLAYQVDIPIDSKNLIPDFLANEGVDALNFTIAQLEAVTPIIEKVYLVTAVVSMAAFVLKTAAHWSRLVTSRVEAYFSLATAIAGKTSDKQPRCPEVAAQSKLYLRETIENWCDLIRNHNAYSSDLPSTVLAACNAGGADSEPGKTITLEEHCPQTASAWKLESSLNSAYRWSWDRSFCRAVPAGWTASESLDKIGTVILKQQQCAVTGKGVPLTPIENCQQYVQSNIINQVPAVANPSSSATKATLSVAATKVSETGGTCWRAGNIVYYKNPALQNPTDNKNGIYVLTPVGDLFGGLVPEGDTLLVYKPQGSESFMVARDVTCADLCRTSNKIDQYVMEGCYDEQVQADGTVTLERGDTKLIKNRYPAGYTKDCFIKGYDPHKPGSAADIARENGRPVFQQCVCAGKQPDLSSIPPSTDRTLRTAMASVDGAEEIYSFREDQIFKESKGTVGTYYPKERYYAGRDFSGAFGADYLLDYLGSEKEVHEVNPHTQLIGTFQSVCLSGILKNLKVLNSILVGMRNCLVSAKYTGLQDAGACKTLFTQHVCGLLYQGIAYLSNQCSPLTFDDKEKEGNLFGDAGEVISQGFKAIPQALQDSINDVQRDYGNAKLNEYFREGAQGFAQSMCLAAFGIEFPLFSTDFLLDAAYTFPTKSIVVLGPRQRELSTVNPARQTAVFNYNIGGVIMPGCIVRNWKLSLKCIGPEDLSKPGVDSSCGGQGCDCLNAQGQSSGVGQKEYLLKSGFNLKSGELFSIPLESPLKVDAPYRYDHVKVELYLDQLEKDNAKNCFEEGYFDGVKGVFYEPLVDTSPPAQISCQANLLTGEYHCPELSNLLGFGGAFIEEPQISCWNKNTNAWTTCDTPNLFVASTTDPIKLGVHVNLDNNAKCLRRTVTPLIPGVQNDPPFIRPLPANTPGQLIIPDVLTTVDPSMFSGVSSSIQLAGDISNRGCGLGFIPGSTASSASGSYRLTFIDQGDGTFQVQMQGTFPETPGYAPGANAGSGSLLVSGSQNKFTESEINKIVFNMGGEKVTAVIRNVNDLRAEQNRNFCEYRISSAAFSSQQLNTRQFTVQYQLLEADEAGGCQYATLPVRTTQGRTAAAKLITIQKEEQVFQQGAGIAEQFQRKNYDQVLLMANSIISQRRGDLANALAIYYSVAATIKKGEKERNNPQLYQREVDSLLSIFFDRPSAVQTPYESAEENKNEFKKIAIYLCQVDGSFGKKYSNHNYC